MPFLCYLTGTLVNSVIEDFVLKIIGLQDISADSAIGLVNILCLLKKRIPPLFKVEEQPKTCENDVIKAVKIWTKMLELIVLLEAHMRDIVDRWADGKGPLTSYFTAEEVKQLIRALFQNTDRRAQVLAKIV